MHFVDLPDLLRDLPVALFAVTFRIFQPPVIRGARDMETVAETLYRVMFFFRQFPDRLVFI
jgi:hypothetical protein